MLARFGDLFLQITRFCMFLTPWFPSLCPSLLYSQDWPLHCSTEPEHTSSRWIWAFCYRRRDKNLHYWPTVTTQPLCCLQPQVSALLQPKARLQPPTQSQSQIQAQATDTLSAQQLSGRLHGRIVHLVTWQRISQSWVVATVSILMIFCCDIFSKFGLLESYTAIVCHFKMADNPQQQHAQSQGLFRHH